MVLVVEDRNSVQYVMYKMLVRDRCSTWYAFQNLYHQSVMTEIKYRILRTVLVQSINVIIISFNKFTWHTHKQLSIQHESTTNLDVSFKTCFIQDDEYLNCSHTLLPSCTKNFIFYFFFICLRIVGNFLFSFYFPQFSDIYLHSKRIS